MRFFKCKPILGPDCIWRLSKGFTEVIIRAHSCLSLFLALPLYFRLLLISPKFSFISEDVLSVCKHYFPQHYLAPFFLRFLHNTLPCQVPFFLRSATFILLSLLIYLAIHCHYTIGRMLRRYNNDKMFALNYLFTFYSIFFCVCACQSSHKFIFSIDF